MEYPHAKLLIINHYHLNCHVTRKRPCFLPMMYHGIEDSPLLLLLCFRSSGIPLPLLGPKAGAFC